MATKLKTKDEVKGTEKLSALIGEGKDRRKGTRGIDKKSVTIHKGGAAPSDGTDSSGVAVAAPGTPTPDQLARINSFTRSPKTADEVYVLETLSANDLPDRDDDYFDTDTLKAFAELPQPYSPVGKSYMVGHDYSQLPQGRIFGVGTQEQGNINFLTNEVYIPNTDSNKSFIESVDFGVNWAVSVGVLLEAQLCSICKEPQYSGWFMGGVCETGHFKGAMYNPSETRTDDWGYIIEAEPNDPQAVKALGNMHGAKDFYELSQVFLGAQFFAALDSTKGVARALKGISAKHIPILGLSSKDATDIELPLQHAHPKLADALTRYEVSHEKDGSSSWTDGEGLSWSYEPGGEVLCLGKTAETDDDEVKEEADGEAIDRNGSEADGDAGGAGEVGDDSGVEGAEHDRAGDVGEDDLDSGGEGDAASGSGSDGDLTDTDEDTDSEDSSSDDDSDDTKDKEANVAMDKATLLKAIKASKLPSKFTALAVDASGDGLTEVLRAVAADITTLNATVAELGPKAKMGDKFMQTKRADAIAAYVKAKGIGTQKGVDTTSFEKILDGVGDNVDLLDALIADYTEQYKALLPGAKLRSSAQEDPNARHEPTHGEPGEVDNTPRTRSATVSRIHG